jgi:hypothetical protein
MAFKKFVDYGAASRDEATLRVSGNLFLSKSIVGKSNIADPQYALLYVDEDELKVGIEFFSQDTGEKALRKVSKEKSGYSVNLTPILRHMGIGERKKKSSHDVAQEEGLLVISLKEIKEVPKDELNFM